MAKVVVALGGSLLRPEVKDRHNWLMELVSILRDRVSSGDSIALVVGGGAPAREGIELARPIIGDISHLDRIGIAATRLNATIVRETLSDRGIKVSEKIPESVEEAASELGYFDVVVMGGTVPGHTTDAVAISLAIEVGAMKCVIATNVSNVYSEDPNSNPGAKAFENLTLNQLQEIVGPPKHGGAGGSQVVDPVGVGNAVANGLALDILDGRKTERIRGSLEEREFDGTKVRA